MRLTRTQVTTLVGVLFGALLTSTMVVRTTQAVFTGSQSSNQSWSSGGAQISSDGGTGTASFSSATDGLLVPGQSITKCIVVTYQGHNPAANIKLYATGVTGNLPAYLDVTVQTGTSTSVNGDCTGWSAGSTIFPTNTLATFAAGRNSFANGLGPWATTVAGEKLTYRFTVSVQNQAAAQNQTGSATFTWEAQAV